MRIAAIDLGSNSFHMLVAEVRGAASFETVRREKMMIQLGKTALLGGRRDGESMQRGLRCLEEFRRMAISRGVERTLAVATSAIREAENGEEFLHRAHRESGIAVRVISGREEARLIHLAVSHHLDLNRKRALLIDVGGGSVELAVGDASRLTFATSQKLGFLRLHGRFVTGDPITRRQERDLRRFLEDAFSPVLTSIRTYAPELAVATSGTATTLLRLVQQRRGSRTGDDQPSALVFRDEIRSILADTLYLRSAKRARDLDLDPLRSEYFPTAVLCLSAILEGLGLREVHVSPVALREGVIYDYLARSKPRRRLQRAAGDLRQQAVIDLATRCAYPEEHSHRVAPLARQIFEHTAWLHGLGAAEGRLPQRACILHDIGYHIGYSKHHKHGYYLVMNGDLRGFTSDERNILAQLVRYHRGAKPKTTHAPYAALSVESRWTVQCLAAILRVADGLDRSHYSLIDGIRCRRRRKSVEFRLLTGSRLSQIDLDLYSGKRNARYFEKLFGVDTTFVPVHSTPRATRRSTAAGRKRHSPPGMAWTS